MLQRLVSVIETMINLGTSDKWLSSAAGASDDHPRTGKLQQVGCRRPLDTHGKPEYSL